MNFWLGLALMAVAIWMVVSVVSLFRRVTVFEYQHGLRFVNGRFEGDVPAGSYWTFKPRTRIELVDARPRVMTVPGQEILSADGVTLKVSLLLDVRVTDARRAVLESESYEAALYAHAQDVLRLAIGEHTIEAVLTARAELAERLQAGVAPRAAELGLELRSITVKDIMFPGALKEAFSETARARQEAQASLERARGEQATLRSLSNAARLLDKNPHLFQLRLLQTAAAGGNVVVKLANPSDPAPTEEASAEDE